MAVVWAQLNLNSGRIGSISAQRRPHPYPVTADTLCTYRWAVDLWDDLRTGTVTHRHGDGQWRLIARVLHAAGHTPKGPP